MKFEKFQLRGNNSVYVEAFQLLRGRASAQLRGNIVVQQTCIQHAHLQVGLFAHCLGGSTQM
jgi:hypothetical protein